jgi:hypothetical protein
MLQNIARLGFGGLGIPTEMPKAIAELQGLTVNVLTGVAANTQIAVPGIEAWDTILTAIMFAGGVPSDITGNASIVDRRASATLTIGAVAAGDSITIAGKTYFFVSGPSAIGSLNPSEIPVLPTAAGIATTMANVIMSNDSRLYASAAGSVVKVFWRVLGAVGNAATLSVANSNVHVTASGANFAGGTDTQAVSFNSDTTGNKVLLAWYNKNAVAINAPLNYPGY